MVACLASFIMWIMHLSFKNYYVTLVFIKVLKILPLMGFTSILTQKPQVLNKDNNNNKEDNAYYYWFYHSHFSICWGSCEFVLWHKISESSEITLSLFLSFICPCGFWYSDFRLLSLCLTLFTTCTLAWVVNFINIHRGLRFSFFMAYMLSFTSNSLLWHHIRLMIWTVDTCLLTI